ncbi:glycosyltransferase [Demequina activiva]|uniref:D-inositol 3-phosphate glycosyltransferase n=1 Tax=Demequina activiva TaxID=1582364 RepID=A0A919Q781_9MICO|nr:glycosyltransferase [Demequina activiva]GIG55070.1 GDP-mannose-dependent alpha-(1-6)-phosphatidylinositol dimannoside mannosyltransferase [Demequina activiva]
MRIAHVANFYGPTSGGLRTAMHQLGRGYLERGHEFLMVVPGPADADEETPFGRRVSIASPVLPLTGGYRLISRVQDVREALTGFRPDALEVSDRTTLRGLGPWARDRSIPSVFLAHERADGVLTANLPSWLGRGLVERTADAHNRGTARRFTTVVATTAYAAEEFERIGVSARLVPLGVDLEQFDPSRRDPALRSELTNEDEALLLMASRLSPEKRPDLAIEAVRVLVSRGRRVRLVSAGAGTWSERMRAQAHGLPITFLGFVESRERFAALLATADAVVAPGPIETFGLAALEALASGTPAVVHADSALPSVVGTAGESASSAPEAFADAIERILDAPQAQQRVRARARAETMPWSATVESLLSLHRESLAAPEDLSPTEPRRA